MTSHDLNRVAFSATVHCLTGCAIGEVLGMIIGTALGFSDLGTIALAVVLAFFFGYTLTSLPLLRSGMALGAVVPIALASDTISIAIMEVVDNAILLLIPGAMDLGLGDAGFWASLAVALLIAGAAAYPVEPLAHQPRQGPRRRASAPRPRVASPAMSYPPGFRFGAATAAYQIEGAWDEDGRGESIWDRFSHTPGKVAHGDSGDVACDHYHRWREDLDLLVELGVESYRFSISWPRVQPDGRGALNEPGVRFYRELVEGLLERGIEPMATLYHWDLPQALEDAGGWQARDTTERFAAYAAAMAERLGDVVAEWITHNEPWVVAFLGYAEGTKAPGVRDWPTALRVSHHLLLSHGRAVQALRAALPAGTPVGITCNLHPQRPASDTKADRAAARIADGYANRWFLDPVFRGRYPEDLLARYAEHYGAAGERARRRPGHDRAADRLPRRQLLLPAADRRRPGRRAARRADGAAAPAADRDGVGAGRDRAARDAHPAAARLRRRADRHHRERRRVPRRRRSPAGASTTPTASPTSTGTSRRSGRRSTRASTCARYFVWSFLDNFEWEQGYEPRFGIVRVDYDTQVRTPKRSAHWYRDHIAAARGA